MKKINYVIILIILFGCEDSYEPIKLKNGIQKDFVNAALERTKHQITYNNKYFKIDYPNGDIPDEFGVCTDVVIRSYRKINIDLQQLLHEDIKNNFNDYPIKQHWPKQRRADSNIDHRRVPNLEFFFSKYGESIPVSTNKKDYKPGDIITWDLMGASPWHIGVVINKISSKTNNPLIVHNIGKGPVIEDVIFDFPIRGHYRYIPKK
tara:strand:- start:46 stop:663 length:618 start_codon:yes stop_codon:yes gene_type:complete